ncbi:16S rRNA (guanine(966)-N(2))-methyltransferase RsmD [Pulveribacter suum]|uniref:16S rRNA (Guanine(966)-N(2))-methyltransferase RsmD n=1 Tax=Pulveribacter suum TaxID=2116657 RepID=A0A2P1NJ88_9BURK|nr:16S rRNA (guanine(966)-N(2))-methyltransferase RsmD [Pulveribacter suum]AVP57050.1 16S rRNA (guanine(966)-N(2))-methyltransferase RsmD [Pulveribacter suum]
MSAARKKTPATARVPGPPPGEVRIIGGQWKRSKLPVPDKPGLRPTPDRVRETLFNWLGQDLTGWHCLDAFAGTGALGLEAASRGATAVLLVEHDAGLCAALARAAERLRASAVRVQCGDGLAALRAASPGSLHLVLLDPPFGRTEFFAPALEAAARAIAAEGFIYLEAPSLWGPDALAASGLALHRHLHAGAVHAHLLRRVT